MQVKSALAAVAALILAGPALAQAPRPAGQPEGAMTHPHTLLTITAEADVAARPDIATIAFGVQTSAPTAAQALADNAARMTAVLAALRKAGVAERDVQTSTLSLNPQYLYAEREPPRVTGYDAVNQVSVKVRDTKNLGRVMDAVVGAGVNQVNGVSFGLDKPDAALDQARRDALAKARARAELYASAAGMKVARIVAIQEGRAAGPLPPPMPMMAKAAMAESTPVAPGEVSLTATVTAVFALE